MEIDELVELMRLEFSEHSGLRITEGQACLLWELPARDCRQALEILLQQRFLARTADGAYIRRGVPPTRWSAHDPAA